MSNIENIVTINEFISLRDLENQLYDVIEGELDFNKRKIQLNIIGEREGVKFYRTVCAGHTGWIPKINTDEHIMNNIEYWIAPNAIVVYPKILKDE